MKAEVIRLENHFYFLSIEDQNIQTVRRLSLFDLPPEQEKRRYSYPELAMTYKYVKVIRKMLKSFKEDTGFELNKMRMEIDLMDDECGGYDGVVGEYA